MKVPQKELAWGLLLVILLDEQLGLHLTKLLVSQWELLTVKNLE